MMSKDNLTASDLQKIQKYIDKKSKKESLDTALLFFSSSFSIFFTLIHIYFGELLLLYFLPTLFLGWVMPVYIGFIRGSLTLDLVEERVRGWIYLIAGAGLYLLVIFLIYFEMQVWVAFLLFVLLGFIIGFKLNIIMSSFLKIFGQELTDQIYKSYSLTTISALFLSFFFIELIAILKGESVIVGRVLICLFGFGAIYFEIRARQKILPL